MKTPSAHRPRCRFACPLVLFLAMGFALPALALDPDIEVVPGAPTDVDDIVLRITGSWGDSCAPQLERTIVNEDLRFVIVEAVANPECLICSTVITPYAVEAAVGQTLAAGGWQAMFRVRRCEGLYEVLALTSFTVTETLAASFTWEPETAIVGEPVQFRDGSRGSPTTWSWDFGDGSSSSEQHPTHVFASAGEQVVSLMVSDGIDSATNTATVVVEDPPRFEVGVSWRDFDGNTGQGQAMALAADTIGFWFFNQDNIELAVKVLDGRGVNGHFWVFYGALSNVEYTVVVTDRETGNTATYDNPMGHFASVGDTDALPGDGKGAGKYTAVHHGRTDLDALRMYTHLMASDSPKASGPQSACTPGEENLCLNGSRFSLQVTWRDFDGNTGTGHAVPLTSDTGMFWFFDQANVELVVKVLDGRQINGHFWVFYGALSNVEYTLTVTDTGSGQSQQYENPLGTFASVGDTAAFPLP